MLKINWYVLFKPHVLHRFYKIADISKPKYSKFRKKIRGIFIYNILKMTSFRITTTCSNCGKIIPRNFEDNKSICYECLLKINNVDNIKYGWVKQLITQ